MREDAQPPVKVQLDEAALARRIMKRQASLSLRLAAIFVAILIGLPLANQYAREGMNTAVGGFTVTWLILGIAFFPLTWALSAYFVKASNRIEEAIVQDEKR